ncbi:MAG TPA: putative molybdenum carrier protein [Desulfuromonadaceae bacterium]|jgi:predicted Rossmann-fold nucleotide-binding protein
MTLKKIVSGGQTGADRAGLDAAMEAGLPVGGYCPKGRLAEDGTVPDMYPLIELTKGGYSARTEKNVIESDGTLILNIGKVTGGTKLTLECTRKHNKPCLVVQLDNTMKADAARHWIDTSNIAVLNVAGQRESKCPGLHATALEFLRQVFNSEHNLIYKTEECGIFCPDEQPLPYGCR